MKSLRQGLLYTKKLKPTNYFAETEEIFPMGHATLFDIISCGTTSETRGGHKIAAGRFLPTAGKVEESDEKVRNRARFV